MIAHQLDVLVVLEDGAQRRVDDSGVELRLAEARYDKYRQKLAPVNGSVAIAGMPVAKTAPSPVAAKVQRSWN